MNIPTIHLVLLIAAAWRLSNLLANEDGPWLMFRKLRRNFEKWDKKYRWFRKSHLKEGISCEYCNSIWFGLILGGLYLLLPTVATALAFPLALSTGAILIKHATFLLKSADTRLDQQNQSHIEWKKLGSSEWEPKLFEQNAEKVEA